MELKENFTVKFAFTLDQKVITPFGDEGIVSMLGYDDGGRQYHVKTRETACWFKQTELKPAE